MERQWLIECRRHADLLQNQVAYEVGITPQGMCMIEKGRNTPRPDMARKIAKVLGFDWTRFYTEDDPVS